MKFLHAIFLFITVTLFSLSIAYAAPRYIQSPPLSQVIKDQVVNCGDPPTVQVPLITWGGDIATIFANGNVKTTAQGSIFSNTGLSLSLVREDVFANQVRAFIKCQSPYLRGTMGMINIASEVTKRDKRTELVVIYQLTWSQGGDAMVVKNHIKNPKDLKGKTIAVQAYGPHVDYISKILADAGLNIRDVKIKWLEDLTGTDNSPMAAFYEKDVDAAMVIIPDALALTSSGSVGTGAEDSVKGARILLSTKTANRIIADVYAVRSDYLEKHRDEVEKFVHGLMQAEESLKSLFKNRSTRTAEYQQTLSSSADILLDSPQAVGDVEGLYSDCEYVGWKGNVRFFGDDKYPRNFDRLVKEIQSSFMPVGLITKKGALKHSMWDYNRLKAGLVDTKGVEAPRFDRGKVAKVVTKKQLLGTLDEGTLFAFEVYFQPNQNTFPAEMYEEAFKKVVNFASTYGGAIITVEGHSDPLGFLKKKKRGSSTIVLSQIKQAAKNLSLSRANSVRDSVIHYAESKGVGLDETQFTVIGYGIKKPKSGICGSDPCPPKTKDEWLNNMRVEFKVIQVEAEEVEFEALD